MSKEQLEASLKTYEMLFQSFGIILAIATVSVTGFGLKAWLLSNKIKKLEYIEGLQTQEKIALLNKETADTKERTAKTELEVEKEKVARLALEKQVGPRTFSPEQEKKLQAELLKFHVDVVDVLGYYHGDEESKLFTKKLATLLEKSGWHPRVFWLADVANPISGLRLEFKGWENPPAANALYKAMTEIGIHISDPIPQDFPGEPQVGGYGPVAAGTKPDAAIRIFVGRRW
jgi:hypothetical protein